MNIHCSLLWCEKVLFTNKLSDYWCHIIKPYLFIKFHVSKRSAAGKRVTQTCMPYSNMDRSCLSWFSKSKLFTKTFKCLFPVHHQTLYHQVSYVRVLRLVRFTNPTRRRRGTIQNMAILNLTPIVKTDPFLTKRSFDGIVMIM